jgi:predicted transcriptional regulator
MIISYLKSYLACAKHISRTLNKFVYNISARSRFENFLEQSACLVIMDTPDTSLPDELFMELASSTRCQILLILKEKPTRTNKIAQTLGLSVQETHRNTSRLAGAKIIIKDSEGLFSLTEYGKLIVEQIKFYQFLNKHQKFFEDHTCDLPHKFKQRLGV